jgi:hypothetical protein
MTMNDLFGRFFQQKVQESVGFISNDHFHCKKDASVLLNKCRFLSSAFPSNPNFEFKEISAILGDDIPK